MRVFVFAALVLAALSADPENNKETPKVDTKEGKPALNVDTDTAKKFKDLGNETRDVTARWKRYPHRQNRTNETNAALSGDFKNAKSFIAAPEKEKETPKADSKKGNPPPGLHVDTDTAEKFNDLGKETRNITARWKRYPHRQNRTNETNAALRGHFKNVSFCGQAKKVPMKFRYLWKVKNPTENDILGSPAQRAFNVWTATKTNFRSSALQTKVGLRGSDALKHPGEDSFAKVGSGSDQKLAEGGATGQVAGKEAFATVLKDGFWPVGCYTDKMLTTADKFGDEKDKYKDLAGVSIANYDDLVDDADKLAMTPTVCFEFCSTLPDMVFFGITEGRSCYCTPYFSPGPGDGSKCDAVCAGDTTLMCGSTTGRSSMFEMHLCNE